MTQVALRFEESGKVIAQGSGSSWPDAATAAYNSALKRAGLHDWPRAIQQIDKDANSPTQKRVRFGFLLGPQSGKATAVDPWVVVEVTPQ